MTPFAFSGILILVGCLSLGIFVLRKSADKKLGRIWCAFNIVVAVWGLTCVSASMADSAEESVWYWRIGWAFGVVWIPCVHLHFVHILCKLQQPRLVLFHYIIASLLFLAWPTKLIYPNARWVFDSFYYASAGALHPVFMGWWLTLIIYIHAALIKTYRKAPPDQKNRLLYYCLSTAIGYFGGSIGFFPVYGVDIYPWGNFTVFIYPLVMTYAIFKHQLLDIQIVIRKTFVYSIVTATLAGIYVFVLTLLAHTFDGFSGKSGTLSSAGAAGVIALLFHPLRKHTQRLVDRFFPREKLDQDVLREAAGGFAHEMKRPLAQITLPAELALNDVQRLKDGENSAEEILPKLEQRLKYIIDQSIDAGLMIEAIRELSMPEAVPQEEIELKSSLNAAAEQEKGLLEKVGVTLRWEWPENVPKVHARPRQLRIIFSNLIRNACEAMGRTCGERLLRVRVEVASGMITLLFSDTGIGLSPEIQSRLFQPSFTTKGARGTGMGLYLSRQLAQANGGTLLAKPSASGAEFHLSLPLH